MAEAVDTQALEVEAMIPPQGTAAEIDKRIVAFRAANLAVAALFEQGLSADHWQVLEANEHAEAVFAGRARISK